MRMYTFCRIGTLSAHLPLSRAYIPVVKELLKQQEDAITHQLDVESTDPADLDIVLKDYYVYSKLLDKLKTLPELIPSHCNPQSITKEK